MARRKEQELQQKLTNQEEWDTFINKPGLTVIDCYQTWCGPCKPMVGLLKRIKIEISSEILNFAIAECDSIDSLELYRHGIGNCEVENKFQRFFSSEYLFAISNMFE